MRSSRSRWHTDMVRTGVQSLMVVFSYAIPATLFPGLSPVFFTCADHLARLHATVQRRGSGRRRLAIAPRVLGVRSPRGLLGGSLGR